MTGAGSFTETYGLGKLKLIITYGNVAPPSDLVALALLPGSINLSWVDNSK